MQLSILSETTSRLVNITGTMWYPAKKTFFYSLSVSVHARINFGGNDSISPGGGGGTLSCVASRALDQHWRMFSLDRKMATLHCCLFCSFPDPKRTFIDAGHTLKSPFLPPLTNFFAGAWPDFVWLFGDHERRGILLCRCSYICAMAEVE